MLAISVIQKNYIQTYLIQEGIVFYLSTASHYSFLGNDYISNCMIDILKSYSLTNNEF